MNMETENINEPVAQEQNEAVSNWQAGFVGETAGNEAEEDFTPSAEANGTRNTIAVFIACAVTIGSLYAFAVRHRPQEASAEEKAVDAQLDLALAKLMVGANAKSDAATATDLLIQAFYDYPTHQQVSLDDLRTNPFRWAPKASMSVTLGNNNEPDPRVIRMSQLDAMAGQLVLGSVIVGSGEAKCMINGQVLRVGDMVAETFTVDDIRGDGVVLMAAGSEFILQM